MPAARARQNLRRVHAHRLTLTLPLTRTLALSLTLTLSRYTGFVGLVSLIFADLAVGLKLSNPNPNPSPNPNSNPNPDPNPNPNQVGLKLYGPGVAMLVCTGVMLLGKIILGSRVEQEQKPRMIKDV